MSLSMLVMCDFSVRLSFYSIYVRTAQASVIHYIVESVGGDVRPPSVWIS
jgi:hypothetical protein